MKAVKPQINHRKKHSKSWLKSCLFVQTKHSIIIIAIDSNGCRYEMLEEEFFEIAESLDSAEAVLVSESRPFERVDNEIHFSASISYTELHGHISVREDKSSFGFAYIFEQKVPQNKRADVAALICLLNEALWIGHFEINTAEDNILWRYTISLIARNDPEPAEIAAIMAAGVEACEKFYPAFNFMLWAGKTPEQAAQAALFETAGEA